MIPLKSDESFELTIPWGEQKIKLNQFSQNTHNWNAYATSALLNPDQRMFHGFFLKTSKESKNYDGLVNIRGENIDIIVAGRQVTPENLEEQLTTSTLKTDNGGSIIAYKKENIGGHTVLKGQYIDEMVGGTKQETHYLIPLKNRIWTVVSSVYDDDQGKYPNTSQRINIIEQIIATLPDNPPDIVTTYTNPQTKNQLRLPKNWAVVQDFPDGRPRDIGIVELDKVENASSISVYCGRQLVPVLDYVIRSDGYKKVRFANRDVVVHDDGVFYLYTKDKAGACNLAITNYDKEKDKDKLAIAEKLFATENP